MVHSLTGGGAERVAALWAKGFVERGHKVGMVLSCKKDTPVTYAVPSDVGMYNINGLPIISWIANKLYRKLKIDTYYTRRVHDIFLDFQPDVIIGVLQPWAEWARKASRGMNIPIINTEHNSFEWPEESGRTKMMWQQKYEWNKRYNHVTVLTAADKICVDKILSNVSVLPNPLAYAPISEMPKKEKIILAVGRLDAWHVKGFDILIKAWGKLSKNYPEWELQIAGNSKGKGREFLQTLADEVDLGKQLKFIGYQSDMLPIYQRSSIFVLPSRYEGFGMVLIEAMSQGCACIACDYKGRQHEIIINENQGILCPTEDVEALALALQKIITDTDYRTNLQVNAIERSKYYSVDNTIDRWGQILKKVRV